MCVNFLTISHTDEYVGKLVPVKCHTYILQIGSILKIGTAVLSASCPGHSTLMVSCTSAYSLGGWVLSGSFREEENLLPQTETEPYSLLTHFIV
jgi:hypothetical protein